MRVYGPVPSRRFGLSLGIDIIPHKTCQFDCIYCQLGPSEKTTATPECFYTIEDILKDVREALLDSPRPDVITLAGSGDPTLYSDLEQLIVALKELCDVKVLLITNGATLCDPRVASAALRADILAPSLDAGDPETFARVNRPHPDIHFDDMVRGLQQVTHAHRGEVRLEIMLIAGVNDSEAQMRAMAEIVRTLRFDQIDLNTPVRPPVPERGALPCDETVLALAQSIFGDKAQPIGRFIPRTSSVTSLRKPFTDQDKNIRETLLRRPCTIDDLCAAFKAEHAVVSAVLDRLMAAGLVRKSINDGRTYFHGVGDMPEGLLTTDHLKRE